MRLHAMELSEDIDGGYRSPILWHVWKLMFLPLHVHIPERYSQQCRCQFYQHIMSSLFCVKVISTSFFVLDVWLYTIWHKKIGGNAALKMPIYFGQKSTNLKCKYKKVARKFFFYKKPHIKYWWNLLQTATVSMTARRYLTALLNQGDQ